MEQPQGYVMQSHLKKILGGVVGITWSAFSYAMDGLPEYKIHQGVSGNLSSIGSETLSHVMSAWFEAFQHLYPNVAVQVQVSGSSTAPPALLAQTSQLATMSRRMTSEEKANFTNKHGYPPTQIKVVIDAPAFYVHKDNPIQAITFRELDAIYSANRRCGAKLAINTWGDLGLKGDWKNRGIQLYGRNSASGTYAFVKQRILCKGDYLPNVNEQPSSGSVLESVNKSLNSIGYSGLGHINFGVKPLALAKKKGGRYILPSRKTVLAGDYPLARFLYIYINLPPNTEVPPLEKAFLDMVLSKTGQDIAEKSGYLSLPPKIVRAERQKIKLQ